MLHHPNHWLPSLASAGGRCGILDSVMLKTLIARYCHQCDKETRKEVLQTYSPGRHVEFRNHLLFFESSSVILVTWLFAHILNNNQ
jgi:hypothetical protein